MNYYLSDSDVKILKQTVNTVNNLPSSQRNKSRPTIKHAFAYVELTEQNEDGLWSAKEVYFDETGTASELVDGRTWGADSVYIIVNGTVSVGQVVRVEAYYMVDANGAEQAVWVGSAIGGGGTTIQRLQAKADVTLTPLVNDVLNFRSVTFINSSISESIIVVQNKVAQVFYEENEIIYAEYDAVNSRYILDPFIFAQGIQNATI